MKYLLYDLIVLLMLIPIDGLAQVGFNKIGFINQEGDTNSQRYYSVVIDSNHKILVVGQTDTPAHGLIARYNSDGTLDTTFNQNSVNGGPGYINQADATNSNAYYSVVIDRNNKILVVGQTDNDDGLVARYNQDGTLDETFNDGLGFVNQEGGTDSNAYYAVVIDNDNKILVVGRTNLVNQLSNGLIARYNQDGTIDETFNGGLGYIKEPGNTNSIFYNSVVIDNNNKILVVGQTDPRNGLIVRYNQDGTLDETFNAGSINGGPGYINNEVAINSSGYYSVIIDNNNKILVIGQTNTNPGNGLIARYNQDGTLDETFNAGSINGGPGYINQEGFTDSFRFNSVVIDNNNNVLVVGYTDIGLQLFNGLIARYNQDGILDATFNPHSINGGPGYINQEGFTDSWMFNSVVIDSNNKILVVGQTDASNGLIARYLANGVFDTQNNWSIKNMQEIAQINRNALALLG